MKRIINYFVKNYQFTTYQIGQHTHTLIKDNIHIFLYVENNTVIFNNIIFENINSVKDLKFIYFNCKGLKLEEIKENEKELIIERDIKSNNILKYK